MSKFERKYGWKHILLIVALFVLVASVNLIPRESIVSSPCEGTQNSEQAVKVTSRGFPLTYAKKYEATKICVVFKDGKYTGTNLNPKQEMNVAAVVFNEIALLSVVLIVVWLGKYAWKKLKKSRKNPGEKS